MESDAVLRLRPELAAYLRQFESCMGKRSNRGHLRTYVEGQLGPLARKSVEPMALAAGTPVRTLQEFLSMFKWDHTRLRDLHQRRVARRHHHPRSVAYFDETSFPKKGRKTAGVQRQHCGRLGKIENCVVSVHLAYATPTFHTLLDGEPFLPEHTWHEDRERCREAGVPDDVLYRSKGEIALGQLRRARANGVRPAWVGFDEGYGAKPWLLLELDREGQVYAGEVPRSFRVWTKEPRVRSRSHPCDAHRGEGPALMVQSNPMITVDHVAGYSPKARGLEWISYVVNDATTGPLVWEAIRLPVWLRDERGLPTRAHHLVIARSVLVKAEIRFFLSNAPEGTPVEDILFVAFGRWRIERLFQDGKTDLGLDHFEVRRYVAIQRHLILSCVSHAFLAEFCERERPKSAGPDGEPGPRRRPGSDPALDQRAPLFAGGG